MPNAESLPHYGIAEWDRRRRASERMAPIDDRGTVDPWVAHRRPMLTPKQVDGAGAAAEHLLSHGLPALFEPDLIRAIWKAGHHDLACDLWDIYADRWTAA